MLNFSLRRVKALYVKEVKEFLRDRITRIVVFTVPLLVALILGYGLALDVENVPFAVYDEDMSNLSREFVSKFKENREYFDFKGYVNSLKELEKYIIQGKIRFGLVIPPDFEERLKEGKKAYIQILIDGTFPYRAEVISSYTDAVATNFTIELLNLERKPFSVDVRYWFNEELKQKYVTSSGVLAIIFMISPAAFATIISSRERERGTIYNIYISPVKKIEYFFGKQLLILSVYVINFFILFSIVVLLFKVPFRGNFPFYFISTLIYILGTSSIGLLMTNFLKTQLASLISTIIITVIPAFLYSGYLVPVSSMGIEGSLFSKINPAYYYLNIVKGSFLKGAGVYELLPNLLFLILFYIFIFSLTLKTFSKRER